MSNKLQSLSSPDAPKRSAEASEASADLPKHIAIIMDGNNRWAKARGLSGGAGHKEGAKAVKQTVKHCVKRGVQVLTVFAFSSENWRRPPAEVELLMQLFMESLESEVDELNQNGVKLCFVGDLDAFSAELRSSMERAMKKTEANQRFVFNVAVNYGGRWDITEAARTLAAQVKAGSLEPEEIDEMRLDACMTLSGLPAVDLCIRTSGEERISNFLLWQVAYSELYFTPCLWPDFDGEALDQALDAFKGRQRRFGRTGDQVESC